MIGFSVHDGQWYCDDIPLAGLAAEHGTPLYVYSRTQLVANYRRIAAAFAPLGAHVHYAVKANGNLSVLRALAEQGCGFDAVSGGEVFRALEAGADPAGIAFAGAGKTAAELAYAVEVGVGRMIVEAADELMRLEAVAARQNRKPHASLRLNPDVHAQTHRHLDTGHAGTKFGMDAAEAAALFAGRERFPHVVLDGVHIHIGSQNCDPAATVAAVREALALVAQARAAGAAVTSLDIGGGYPIAYRPGEAATIPAPEAYAQALVPELAGQGLELLIEPGRIIVADAGALVVTVQSLKHNGGRRVVVVDAGMNDLIRPALYDAYHEIAAATPRMGLGELSDVAGPICESADYFGRERMLPPLLVGDCLVILHAGAYGMSMASNYNARPRPAEILVAGATAHLARRRETWEDLIAQEL